jgi:hypothetical protein
MQLTGHWQHLIDDRHSPKYLRPLSSMDRLDQIDKLLKKHLPDLWAERKTLE